MFKHSVPVPRLYKTAAKIYKQVKEEQASVKQLVYEKRHPNIKALYALVVACCQNESALDQLLKRSQLLTKEPRFDPWLARILITELLWGKKRLAGDSKPVKTVLAYEQVLRAHENDFQSHKNDQHQSKVEKPRYVRVNTLFITLNEAIDNFRDEGWILSKYFDKSNYAEFLNVISNLQSTEFLVDIHIPNLLIFPPKTQFYSHPAYKSGKIILQDKASCLPVHILNPTPGSVVLDMCSAPGMKTTQCATLMNNEGTIYAVERNEQRFRVLQEIVDKSGATCIKTNNNDVLQCTPKDFPDVEYILVDPSCSGSGMTDRLEFEAKEMDSRLEKLAGFQIKILRHALTKFPSAKRVVYSTCSIYPEENEDVVRQVLETNHLFKLVPAEQYVNNAWHNFGSSDYGDIGKYCLYAKPSEDLTNGFFVAVFERLQEGEKNVFFNERIFEFKKTVEDRKRYKDKLRKQETEVNNSIDVFEENPVKPDRWKRRKRKLEGEIQNNNENYPINQNEEFENKIEDTDNKKDKKLKQNEEKIDLNEIININNEEVPIIEKVKKKKKKKKDKKDILESNKTEEEIIIDKNEDSISKKPKKKKRKDNEHLEFSNIDENVELINKDSISEKPKKKKKKDNEHLESLNIDENIELINEDSSSLKKKKKKKSKDLEENNKTEEVQVAILNPDESIENKSKKKKKKKSKDLD